MKKHTQKDKSRPARKVVLGGTLIVIVITVVGTLYFLNGDSEEPLRPGAPAGVEATGQEETGIPATEGRNSGAPKAERSVTKAPERVASPDTLEGKWFRTDGNYVIEVVNIDQEGNLEAAYYNPSPINVSKAEAYLEQPPRLYIELQDAGYDGSSYNLTYDIGQDVLRGTYYQATYGQTYQVVFMRQSGPAQ